MGKQGNNQFGGKLTLATIKQRLKHINQGIEILSDTYINNFSKLKLKCSICSHIWYARWNNLNNGRGCPECAKINRANSKKLNHKETKDIILWEQGWERTDNKTEIIGYRQKIEVRCLKCGSVYIKTYHKIQRGRGGCRRCAYNKMRLDITGMKSRLKGINQNIEITDSTSYLNRHTKIEVRCLKCGYEWDSTWNYLYRKQGCPNCAAHNYSSKPEQEIIDFILQYNPNLKIIRNDRSIITNPKTNSPLEIDIYIPELKLAIEYNGMYWHSEQVLKSKNIAAKYYHSMKTELLQNQGIQLLHIFENEWNNETTKEIWKSMILNKIGQAIPVFARNLKIEEVSQDVVKKFLNKNHLQQYGTPSRINIALTYQDSILALMTFSKPRYNKEYEYELIRFCTLLNHRVIGGASKILKYFEKTYKPKSIISYANRRWSDGNLYRAIGFKETGVSNPNYFYCIEGELRSRVQYQKHKLLEKLEKFNPDLSEYDNMLDNGIDRIWDSGNYVFCKSMRCV